MPMEKKSKTSQPDPAGAKKRPVTKDPEQARELGGRKTGLEPTRYGDWEKNGRCIDF
jgi:hypothetical protein